MEKISKMLKISKKSNLRIRVAIVTIGVAPATLL